MHVYIEFPHQCTLFKDLRCDIFCAFAQLFRARFFGDVRNSLGKRESTPALTWRGRVRRLKPGARLLVAEVQRLRFGPTESPRRRALGVLLPDAAGAGLRGAEAPVRRPVRYEGLHAEGQLETFALTSPDGRQAQLVGPVLR